MVIKKGHKVIRSQGHKLKSKRILITAGPTWVPIDNVRVISNIATGKTGVLLANEARRRGAKVTLLLGPISNCGLDKSVNIIRFRFFNELKNNLIKELRTKRYDIVIHSAAVSDFKPAKIIRGKIRSRRAYNLKLVTLPKIIRDIRCLAPEVKLVMFKLEDGISDKALIKKAKQAQNKIGADFVVANRINPYHSFIIDRQNNIVSARNKEELAKKLLGTVLNSKQNCPLKRDASQTTQEPSLSRG